MTIVNDITLAELGEPLDVYELSLSPDYVLEWRFWEAVRELLQNAIDQQKVNPHSRIILDYREPLLAVGNTDCELGTQTLLLGASDKRTSCDTIGQFGEGYKLALLVLTRLSYEVAVFNNGTVWVPRFERSERYDSLILVIRVYALPEPVNGVHFRIRDVSQDDFGKVTENYLGDTPVDRILYEEHMKHRVFVEGLYLCEIASLHYGYNFAAKRIRLDRDRRTAPTFDITYQASRLWEDSGSDKELYDNMKKGVPDVQYVTPVRTSTNKYIVDRYLGEHPGALPIASQQEAERFKGQPFCIVPTPLRDLLRRMHAFTFNREGTPSERLERYWTAFNQGMNAEARREFQAIMEESLLWT